MPKGIHPRNQRAGITLAEKLAFYSDRSGGNDACWLWKGSRSGRRYGHLYWKGKLRKAHRLAMEDATGADLPLGKTVCHRCDVPLCVNPRHLFIATQAGNVADMVAKGRHRVPRGEEAKGAKVSEGTVRIIRSSDDTSEELGRRFGIHPSTVRKIICKKSWRHV